MHAIAWPMNLSKKNYGISCFRLQYPLCSQHHICHKVCFLFWIFIHLLSQVIWSILKSDLINRSSQVFELIELICFSWSKWPFVALFQVLEGWVVLYSVQLTIIHPVHDICVSSHSSKILYVCSCHSLSEGKAVKCLVGWVYLFLSLHTLLQISIQNIWSSMYVIFLLQYVLSPLVLIFFFWWRISLLLSWIYLNYKILKRWLLETTVLL